jgi:hypothetical protein
MERLHQVILSVLLGCIVLGASAISAQDTCSLAVRVLSPDGHRFEVSVTVREKNGRTIEKDEEDKDVYFCDLGILPVEVKVGSDGMCSQTTIRDVPVFADRTYLLNESSFSPGGVGEFGARSKRTVLIKKGLTSGVRTPNYFVRRIYG